MDQVPGAGMINAYRKPADYNMFDQNKISFRG